MDTASRSLRLATLSTSIRDPGTVQGSLAMSESVWVWFVEMGLKAGLARAPEQRVGCKDPQGWSLKGGCGAVCQSRVEKPVRIRAVQCLSVQHRRTNGALMCGSSWSYQQGGPPLWELIYLNLLMTWQSCGKEQNCDSQGNTIKFQCYLCEHVIYTFTATFPGIIKVWQLSM